MLIPMKKPGLLFLSGLLIGMMTAGTAQPVVNGLINEAAYYQIALSNSNNGFGDPNDFGGLYCFADGTALYLGIKGEVESSGDFNQIAIFLDFSGYGGIPTGADFPGGGTTFSNNLAGTNLPADVDYLLAGNRGNTPGSFFVDGVRYGNVPSVLNSGFIQGVDILGNTAPIATGATLGTRMDGDVSLDITMAYRGDFATNPDAGWEMRLPLAAFGGVDNTQNFRVLVALIGGSGFWSDETLPGASATGNFGFGPSLLTGQVAFSTFLPLSTTLPVTLASFTARPITGAVQLDWETTAELQHSHFEVERSADGQEWLTLSRVYPDRAGQGGQVYGFADQQPLAGRNLYRLRQVDLDGQFTYSHTVEAWTQRPLQAWPNPLADRLHLRLTPAEGSSLLTLYDLSGRAVLQHRLAPGAAEVTLDVAHLPAGAYLGRLQTPTGGHSLRLYKQ